jgi:hypothetical protein
MRSFAVAPLAPLYLPVGTGTAERSGLLTGRTSGHGREFAQLPPAKTVSLDQSWSPGRSSRLQLDRAVRQGAIDDLFGAQLLPARWPVDQVAHIRVRNAALDQV